MDKPGQHISRGGDCLGAAGSSGGNRAVTEIIYGPYSYSESTNFVPAGD